MFAHTCAYAVVIILTNHLWCYCKTSHFAHFERKYKKKSSFIYKKKEGEKKIIAAKEQHFSKDWPSNGSNYAIISE